MPIVSGKVSECRFLSELSCPASMHEYTTSPRDNRWRNVLRGQRWSLLSNRSRVGNHDVELMSARHLYRYQSL